MEVTSIDAKIFFGIMELVAIVFFAYISNQIKYNVVLITSKKKIRIYLQQAGYFPTCFFKLAKEASAAMTLQKKSS